MNTPCPSPARIQAFSVGALPEQQQDELRAHFAVCAPCRALSQDFALLESSPASATAVTHLWARLKPEWEARRSRRVWWLLPWLAAPAAAAALLLMLAAPPPPALQLARPPVAGTAYDADQLARLEPAEIVLPAESLLIYRGSAASQADAELMAAFQAYQKHNFLEAAGKFSDLSSRNPSSFEVAFYHGVSLLMIGRPQQAVPVLEHAKSLAIAPRVHAAQWYLALAYLGSSAVGQARRELEILCAAGTESGCEVLRRLSSPPPR